METLEGIVKVLNYWHLRAKASVTKSFDLLRD